MAQQGPCVICATLELFLNVVIMIFTNTPQVADRLTMFFAISTAARAARTTSSWSLRCSCGWLYRISEARYASWILRLETIKVLNIVKKVLF